jgi:hypothetical protein
VHSVTSPLPGRCPRSTRAGVESIHRRRDPSRAHASAASPPASSVARASSLVRREPESTWSASPALRRRADADAQPRVGVGAEARLDRGEAVVPAARPRAGRRQRPERR